MYILLGVDEDTGENRAYIGEAEDIYVRLLQHNKNNVFVNNHLCSNSSIAAVIILGRNSNGYSEWKNKDGIKLKDLID